MTSTTTELDFSVLTELDFPVPCSIPGHGEHDTCDTGPAVWIAEQTHKCDAKILFVCNRFKEVLTDTDVCEEYTTGKCGHVMPFEEFFKVVGKL